MSELVKYNEIQKQFEIACKSAENISIMQNASAAFDAVMVVNNLRTLLSDEVMKNIFMPLMNTKIGFLTDRNGKPNNRGEVKPLYPIEIVRDAIIDAACFGLKPAFNQFNIIAERMYPTKEGYTCLLKNIGVKNLINIGMDKSQSQFVAEIPCKINYEYKGEKNSFEIVAVLKKDSYSSADQLRGKAERRAKKALYEYITGIDLGDADEKSSEPLDIEHEDLSKKKTAEVIDQIKSKVSKNKLKDVKFESIEKAIEFFVDGHGVSPNYINKDNIYDVAKEYEINLIIQDGKLFR